MLAFVSTLAFAIQLLIFAYLYSSHHVRFFQYLLWAWGAYTISKGAKLLDTLAPSFDALTLFLSGVATVGAVGFTLAAALAHRWNYRLRERDLVGGAALAVLLALATTGWGGEENTHLVGLGLGALQVLAGLPFWPRGPRPRRRPCARPPAARPGPAGPPP